MIKRPNPRQLETATWIQSLSGIRVRAISIVLFFIAGFLIILIRSHTLQLAYDERTEKWAKQQYHKEIELYPERGTIYDRNGRELAVDIEVFSIFARPKAIKAVDRPKIAAFLARVLHKKESEILAKLEPTKRFVWLERRLSAQDKKTIVEQKFDGIYAIPEKKRYYPNGPLAGQLLGAVGFDANALGGIERAYDKFLRRDPVSYRMEKDAKGNSYIYRDEPMKDNADVHLSIDRNIQYIAERELKKAMEAYHPKHGFVVVTRPKTGEILAVANAPEFDPNRYRDFPIEAWRNHAFLDVYEPGSTFKAVVVAAALQSGLVTPDEKFFCENGRYRIANKVIRDHSGHGFMSVNEIMQVSSNIGVAKIGQKIGKDLFYKMILDLGFGKRSPLAIPGESAGLLMKPKAWGPVEESNIAFGQGIGVTALQMIQAYGTFANEGTLMYPVLVKSVVDHHQNTIYQDKSGVLRRVMSPQAAKDITVALEGVVTKVGTAPRAALENFTVAGKTGTAQKVENGVYVHGKYVSSFIGYVPAEKPELVIYAVLDEPRPLYYGGIVAAPIFRQVADQALHTLGVMGSRLPAGDLLIEPTAPKLSVDSKKLHVASKNRDELLQQDSEDVLVPMVDAEPPAKILAQGVMPDFMGMSLREVMSELKETPYQVESHGLGFVVAQTPKAGTPVTLLDHLVLTFSPNRE